MPKRRNSKFFHRRPKTQRSRPKKPHTVEYLLEEGTLDGMKTAKARTQALLKYHWEYYSELAHQRSQIQEKLRDTLIQSCTSNYKFEKWQRAVKWKYGLHPLSTAGSLTNIGQRFNTGEKVNSEVPSFPALYLACDKATALQETLGQQDSTHPSLTSQELALINPQSEVIVSVSGVLEKVFDLRMHSKLKGFVELIKDFELSESLVHQAKLLGIRKPETVRKSEELFDSLLDPDWRQAPSGSDVPSNSQIFGHLIFQAGIEGILYPSKLTGKDCLAVFPRCFAFTSSYLVLDDESPHSVVPKRVDQSNWRVCDLAPGELIG